MPNDAAHFLLHDIWPQVSHQNEVLMESRLLMFWELACMWEVAHCFVRTSIVPNGSSHCFRTMTLDCFVVFCAKIGCNFNRFTL